MGVGKYVKYGFYVIIDDSVGWGVNGCVGAKVDISIGGEV